MTTFPATKQDDESDLAVFDTSSGGGKYCARTENMGAPQAQNGSAAPETAPPATARDGSTTL